MFTFAHLSDPHFTSLDNISWASIANKRAMGYLSWHLHRRSEHRPEILECLIQDLRRHQPDHVVITGDLTHLGLPDEFQQARQWLDTLQTLTDVTVIPGNHESYVTTSFQSTLQLWEPYLKSDQSSEYTHQLHKKDCIFPSLRIRGPVAFIGLSSAHPTAPFLATGSIDPQQLEHLADLLSSTTIKGLYRVLLIHHPPLSESTQWRKRLTNATALQHILAKNPVNLILHGHTHKSSVEFLQTPSYPIPVIGVASSSALGTKAGYSAQYGLFRIEEHRKGHHIHATVHGYSRDDHRFLFSHECPLELSPRSLNKNTAAKRLR